MNPPEQLARKISLPLLVFYGLGVILGAGIYVLVGKVAGAAGIFSPLSFMIAATIATITAFSYSDLVKRFPRSAGEVVYVNEGFNRKWLSKGVGWMVVLSGVVSSATLLNGFAGYIKEFVALPDALVIIAVALLLCTLAIWGIAESVWAAAAMTCVEILGLLLVLYFTKDVWSTASDVYTGQMQHIKWAGVIPGAFLAFYAFVGFEDMVNVVEEVKEPKKNMTPAILIAIVVATLLYVLIALVSILALPLDELTASEAPLAHIVETYNPTAANWVSVISLFAVVNGVLIQMVMGSRVLYGMAKEKLAPSIFADVNTFTKTPVKATLVLTVCVVGFALWLPLVTLASFTSFVVLIIFVLINISLCRIRIRENREKNLFRLIFWPVTAVLLNVLLITAQILSM